MGIANISEGMKQTMTANMEKQKQFQKELIMKQRQVQLATQQALGRQRFKYYAGFYALVVIGAIRGFYVQKNPLVLIPIVPLSFITAFQYDLYYGRMLYRVQEQAAKIIREQPESIMIPEGNGLMSARQYKQRIIRSSSL